MEQDFFRQYITEAVRLAGISAAKLVPGGSECLTRRFYDLVHGSKQETPEETRTEQEVIADIRAKLAAYEKGGGS